MFKTWKNASDGERNEIMKRNGKKFLYIVSLILVGYVAGRITCVADYKSGKLEAIFSEIED